MAGPIENLLDAPEIGPTATPVPTGTLSYISDEELNKLLAGPIENLLDAPEIGPTATPVPTGTLSTSYSDMDASK